ncbi:MAG: cation transporter, partial [Synechococcaceae cyanobacterium SM2_3_60]|nr:cation transporter [Synechococcaceae cyanobacterium SM2_3_60]
MVQAVSRQRQVQWVLGLTLALNSLVFVIKLTLGLITGSLSLLADALHSFTDGASNILGLISVHFANPEPDWDHPYGHLKFEAVGALAIAAFLGVAGLEILRSAIERLLGSESVDLTISATSLQFMILVLIINIFVTVYEHREGKRLASRILIADARHTLTDVWVTIVVLAGLWGVQQGWLWVDTALTFPVAALVFWSAWEVLRENLPVLTDR